MPTTPTPVSVKLLALAETTASILYSFYDLLGMYEQSWAKVTNAPFAGASFEPSIVSPIEGLFRSPAGVPVVAHEALHGNAVPDVIIVPDLAIGIDQDPRGRWPEASAWLRRMHDGGATVCSVCTGSLLLADAGLLDGRIASTHWAYVDAFRRFFPQVKLQPERILCQGDKEGTIVTSGGPSSWEDLALYLIARYRGEADAIRAAKVFVLGDKSEGQLLYAALLQPKRHDDRVIADAQAWLADNYAEASVGDLVARSKLPERTFKRRFKAATGYTPIDYMQTLRTEEAKQLLETSSTPVDEVGAAVGYEDPTFFRRLFKRSTGVTPSRYRQRFRAVGQASR
jgi:transcriptional regulator GlxA family with amidase domain